MNYKYNNHGLDFCQVSQNVNEHLSGICPKQIIYTHFRNKTDIILFHSALC